MSVKIFISIELSIRKKWMHVAKIELMKWCTSWRVPEGWVRRWRHSEWVERKEKIDDGRKVCNSDISLCRIAFISRRVMAHVALRDKTSHQFILEHPSVWTEVTFGEATHLNRIGDVSHNAKNIELSQDGFGEINVVHECQRWIVSSTDGIGFGDDRTTRLKGSDDTRFGKEILLSHCFANRCSILIRHREPIECLFNHEEKRTGSILSNSSINLQREDCRGEEKKTDVRFHLLVDRCHTDRRAKGSLLIEEFDRVGLCPDFLE